MDRLVVGKIVKPVGLKGTVKVVPETNNASRFKKLKKVFVESELYELESVSVAGQEKVLIKFKGVDTVELADDLRNKTLYIDRSDAIALQKK